MSRREYVELALIVGQSVLIAFVAVITLMAVLTRYFYYYEPNNFIYYTEMALGVYGVVSGAYILSKLVEGGING